MEIEVCPSCLIVNDNDDASGLNSEEEARVRKGLQKIWEDGNILVSTATATPYFSTEKCGVCGDLPGVRQMATIVKR